MQRIERRTNVTRAQSSVRIDGLNGQPKTALGTFDCNVKFTKYASYAQTFLIIEDGTNLNYPVLLGMDFLKSNKATINIERWNLSLAGKEIPFIREEERRKRDAKCARAKIGKDFLQEIKMLPG